MVKRLIQVVSVMQVNDSTLKVDVYRTYNPDERIWTDTRFEPHVARHECVPEVLHLMQSTLRVGLLWSDEASWVLRWYDYANCTDGTADPNTSRMWSKDGQPAENVMGNGGQSNIILAARRLCLKVNTPSAEIFLIEYGPGLAGHTGVVTSLKDGTCLFGNRVLLVGLGQRIIHLEHGTGVFLDQRSGKVATFTDFKAAGYTLKIGCK